jgi:uncharacterized protein
MQPTAADIVHWLDLRPHPEGGHFRETFRDESHVFHDCPDAGSLARSVDAPGLRPAGSDSARRRDGEGGRAASTAIYFLLARGERSHWHRVDAAEVWHYYAGAPLALEIAEAEGPIRRLRLGADLAAGERPQAVVPARAWQAAESVGDWTLGRLHGCAGVRIHRLRIGSAGVGAGVPLAH